MLEVKTEHGRAALTFLRAQAGVTLLSWKMSASASAALEQRNERKRERASLFHKNMQKLG